MLLTLTWVKIMNVKKISLGEGMLSRANSIILFSFIAQLIFTVSKVVFQLSASWLTISASAATILLIKVFLLSSIKEMKSKSILILTLILLFIAPFIYLSSMMGSICLSIYILKKVKDLDNFKSILLRNMAFNKAANLLACFLCMYDSRVALAGSVVFMLALLFVKGDYLLSREKTSGTESSKKGRFNLMKYYRFMPIYIGLYILGFASSNIVFITNSISCKIIMCLGYILAMRETSYIKNLLNIAVVVAISSYMLDVSIPISAGLIVFSFVHNVYNAWSKNLVHKAYKKEFIDAQVSLSITTDSIAFIGHSISAYLHI